MNVPIADGARQMIEQLCDAAALYASIKVDGYVRAGNTCGKRIWMPILAASLRIKLSLPTS
jgi:hypothetical protein